MQGSGPGHVERRRGFTLIELMVVIAIIVLAAGLMTPTITDFFKNRQLESVRGELGSAFNPARLKAVTEGIRTSLVFFKEGIRVFDERKRRFVNDLFNPDNTPLAKGEVWFVLGFLGGKPSTQLTKYRVWEAANAAVVQSLQRRNGQDAPDTGTVNVVGLPRIIFERDGSLTFAAGADVGSNFFKEEPVPSNSDVIIYQANNTTAVFVDLRPAGQLRSKTIPIGAIVKRPPETPEEGQDTRGSRRKRATRTR